MYLLNAVSNDGEVMLLKVPSDATMDGVIRALFTTERAVNVNITRLSKENLERNIPNLIENSSKDKRKSIKVH